MNTSPSAVIFVQVVRFIIFYYLYYLFIFNKNHNINITIFKYNNNVI